MIGALACDHSNNENQDKLESISPRKSKVDTVINGALVNAYIEISAGSIEKWELNKNSGKLERELIDGLPRTVSYLGYPGNYGMIPNTLLSKEDGGDGDPLDVLVLGNAVPNNSQLPSRIIGVLKLLDRSEQDDKLIAIDPDGPFSSIKNIEELNNYFPGVTEIIETWFVNYKGPGKMKSQGYGSMDEALDILGKARL